jgi:hypothetical protein
VTAKRTGVEFSVTITVGGSVYVWALVDSSKAVLRKVDAGGTLSELGSEICVPLLEKLLIPVGVGAGITEVNIDVMKMVSMLTIVEAGMVEVWLKNEMLVDIVVVVNGGGVVVNIVVKVSTVPHPEGIMLGPAGKHDARPGY